MRVPLRLERSAALFVSMHFASFGGQGSKVLVGCRHISMAHSIFYHFKGHLALTLTYRRIPTYRERDRPTPCAVTSITILSHWHYRTKLPEGKTEDVVVDVRPPRRGIRYRSAKSPRTT